MEQQVKPGGKMLALGSCCQMIQALTIFRAIEVIEGFRGNLRRYRRIQISCQRSEATDRCSKYSNIQTWGAPRSTEDNKKPIIERKMSTILKAQQTWMTVTERKVRRNSRVCNRILCSSRSWSWPPRSGSLKLESWMSKPAQIEGCRASRTRSHRGCKEKLDNLKQRRSNCTKNTR